jgi:hypothetical protein
MCEWCASSARSPSGLAATPPCGYPTDWWRKVDSRPAAGRPTAYAFGRGDAPGLTPKLRSAHLPTLAARPNGRRERSRVGLLLSPACNRAELRAALSLRASCASPAVLRGLSDMPQLSSTACRRRGASRAAAIRPRTKPAITGVESTRAPLLLEKQPSRPSSCTKASARFPRCSSTWIGCSRISCSRACVDASCLHSPPRTPGCKEVL